MISDERLVVIAAHGRESIFPVTPGDCSAMAKELLELRKAPSCQHQWDALKLVECGGSYQYCKLCGNKKLAE